jgi:ubiquitin-like protein Pup
MTQQQQHRRRRDNEDEQPNEQPTVAGLKHDEVDDLLAEIDDVLEEHAEQFVAAFHQMGGE